MRPNNCTGRSPATEQLKHRTRPHGSCLQVGGSAQRADQGRGHLATHPRGPLQRAARHERPYVQPTRLLRPKPSCPLSHLSVSRGLLAAQPPEPDDQPAPRTPLHQKLSLHPLHIPSFYRAGATSHMLFPLPAALRSRHHCLRGRRIPGRWALFIILCSAATPLMALRHRSTAAHSSAERCFARIQALLATPPFLIVWSHGGAPTVNVLGLLLVSGSMGVVQLKPQPPLAAGRASHVSFSQL